MAPVLFHEVALETLAVCDEPVKQSQKANFLQLTWYFISYIMGESRRLLDP